MSIKFNDGEYLPQTRPEESGLGTRTQGKVGSVDSKDVVVMRGVDNPIQEDLSPSADTQLKARKAVSIASSPKSLEECGPVLANALDLADGCPPKLPSVLVSATPKQLDALVEKHTEEVSSAASLTEQATEPKFSEALAKLHSLKDKLGGSPNLKENQKPGKLGRFVLGLAKIFGYSEIQMKMNASVALTNHEDFKPAFFWRNLAQSLHLSENGLSKYEYVSLTLQSLEQLKLHLPEIEAIVAKKPEGENKELDAFIHDIAGLSVHTQLNNPREILEGLKIFIDSFEKSFDQVKEDPQKLEDLFVRGFSPSLACLPARQRHFTEYYQTVSTEMQQGDPSHILPAVDNVFANKMSEFVEKNHKEPTLDEFKDFLRQQNVFGKEARKDAESDEIIKIEEERLTQSAFEEIIKKHRIQAGSDSTKYSSFDVLGACISGINDVMLKNGGNPPTLEELQSQLEADGAFGLKVRKNLSSDEKIIFTKELVTQDVLDKGLEALMI